MPKRSIHIFNPETDYALGANTASYTPPANVRSLRRSLALHPLTYAQPGDVVVLLDADAPVQEEQRREAAHLGVEIITTEQLGRIAADPDTIIRPWGWNRAIRALLLRHDISPTLLPTEAEIDELRRLAHRRTTIDFYSTLRDILLSKPKTLQSAFLQAHPDNQQSSADFFLPNASMVSTEPRELSSMDEVDEALDCGADLCFKAPWSSSGRSVLFISAGEATESQRRQIAGIIKRQGSVMVERALPKALDFATLWWTGDEGVDFAGVSVFGTADGGGYKGNVYAPQPELMARIKTAAPRFGDKTVQLQKRALERIVAGRYKGPLGIDMLALPDGAICPCVEINFRLTMGFTRELFRRL